MFEPVKLSIWGIIAVVSVLTMMLVDCSSFGERGIRHFIVFQVLMAFGAHIDLFLIPAEFGMQMIIFPGLGLVNTSCIKGAYLSPIGFINRDVYHNLLFLLSKLCSLVVILQEGQIGQRILNILHVVRIADAATCT